jgi:hypothetical protein
MLHYIFSGVVHPERAWLNIQKPVPADLRNPEIGIDGTIQIEIYKNQVTASFATETKLLIYIL